MHSLLTVDYVIIIGYLGLSLVAGLIMAKKAGSSIDNYFLAGRSVPWWLLGVTGMANWFDLTGTMIITSFLYMLGPRGLFIEFRGGVGLVLVFMLAYTGKWHRRSGCMTVAEWMTFRFGQGKAAEVVRMLTAAAWVGLSVMMLAYLIRGASLFLGVFFPYPPMVTTLVLITVTTLFTLSSGYYGVVLTDLVQGIIIIFTSVIISVMAWHMIPDMKSFAVTAQAVTGNADWTSSEPQWHTTMPPGYEAYKPLIMMALFYLLRNVLGGMGMGGEQRYFGAKSDRDCGLLSMQQAALMTLRWPLMIGFAVMGIYLVHAIYPQAGVTEQVATMVQKYYPQTTAASWSDLTSSIVNAPAKQPPELIGSLQSDLGPDWRGKLPLVGFNGSVNPEQILPAVLMNQVPTGLKGLIVVALFAAMMSCKNGWVNMASSFCVKDIYQNFLRPKAANRELMWASYVSTLGIVIVSFYLGVAAKSINDLWSWIIMGYGSGTLAPFLLRLYWWRCNAWGMISGMVMGVVVAVLQRCFIPGMPEWEQLVIIGSLSFLGTIAGSLFTAPTSMEVLKNFYRKTRPFGWWGPLRNEFKGEERAAIDRENRLDIITVPFAMLWQVTMYLLPMQLVLKSYQAFFCTLPLFLIGLAGMYFFWWKPMMKREPATPLIPEAGAPKLSDKYYKIANAED